MNTRNGARSTDANALISDEACLSVKSEPKHDPGRVEGDEDDLGEKGRALADKIRLLEQKKCLAELECREIELEDAME